MRSFRDKRINFLNILGEMIGKSSKNAERNSAFHNAGDRIGASMSDSLNQRSEKIIKFLLQTGTATLEQILDVAGSSAPSIRRDLARLEGRGLIRRTHGGATLVEPLLYEPFRFDSSFLAREQRHATEKRRIGLTAAELVLPNETVGLTAGTTTTHIGRSLRHREKIQVVTNAINIGMELCNQPGIRTYITGGVVHGPGRFRSRAMPLSLFWTMSTWTKCF